MLASRDTRFRDDTGRDGEPPALPRRADADHRQARGACRAQGAGGPKGGASIEDYFDALRFGLPRMPALAHRLDKETSGCLVLGRHRKALADLNLLFRNGKVGKTYWAVVEGGPEADEGRIDMPLGRLDDTRGWWMKHDPDGLPSATTWKVLGRADGLHLARARAADRADAPVARALLGDGLPDPGRQHLRQRAAPRRRACICTRARSWCRSTRTSRRSRSSRRCRRT